MSNGSGTRSIPGARALQSHFVLFEAFHLGSRHHLISAADSVSGLGRHRFQMIQKRTSCLGNEMQLLLNLSFRRSSPLLVSKQFVPIPRLFGCSPRLCREVFLRFLPFSSVNETYCGGIRIFVRSVLGKLAGYKAMLIK